MDEQRNTRGEQTRRFAVVGMVVLAAAWSIWSLTTNPPAAERTSATSEFRAGACGAVQKAIEVDGVARGCSHGDDDHYPTPLPEPKASSAAVQDDPAICVGDGRSGHRVQLIYARSATTADRFSAVRGDIERWARGIDDIFRRSSAETGGALAVRWRTTPSCDFDVARAVVSATGATNDFGQTIADLEALGFDDPDHHYLVFMDANALCGVGESYNDTRTNPAHNYNNGNAPWAMFGRLDRGCWSATVAAHELMHTFGAVLESAPNATANGHCTDEWDVMCYSDGPGVSMAVECPDSSRGDLFDCGHDDYFSTADPPSGFLSTNWNTANSSFLIELDAPPTTTTTTPTPTTTTTTRPKSTTTTTAPSDPPTDGAGSTGRPSTARFEPVQPARVLDTRDAIGTARRTPLGRAGTIAVDLAGRGGLPATGFNAVVLNVTTTQAEAGGYVTVWPSGQRRPESSNLNTTGPGQTRANQVIVPVSDTGSISLFASAGGHLIADVVGYFVPDAASDAGRLVAFSPERILDSRRGVGRRGTSMVEPSAPVVLQVTGVGSVPHDGVAAVVLNVTATQSTGSGYVSVYPSGTRRPPTSSLNVEKAGQTIANHVTVPVGEDGRVVLFASRGLHLVADVAGWFTDESAPVATRGLFTPITPTRAFDSRKVSDRGADGTTWTLTLADLADLPTEAAQGVLVLNATVTQTTESGYLTAYPAGLARPLASNLNWSRSDETVPNLVSVALRDGRASIYIHQPAHLIVDVAGYYVG